MTPKPSFTSNRISASDIQTPYAHQCTIVIPSVARDLYWTTKVPRYAQDDNECAPLTHQEPARNDHAHDLVGALEDLMHPQVAQIALDGKVFQVAIPAMQLQGVVHDIEADVGR